MAYAIRQRSHRRLNAVVYNLWLELGLRQKVLDAHAASDVATVEVSPADVLKSEAFANLPIEHLLYVASDAHGGSHAEEIRRATESFRRIASEALAAHLSSSAHDELKSARREAEEAEKAEKAWREPTAEDTALAEGPAIAQRTSESRNPSTVTEGE